MKTSNVVWSVVAGAAVGALLGVLYAPDKGSNTRGRISRKTNEYARGIKDQVNHVVDLVSSPFHKMRDNGLAESPKRKLTEVTR